MNHKLVLEQYYIPHGHQDQGWERIRYHLSIACDEQVDARLDLTTYRLQ